MSRVAPPEHGAERIGGRYHVLNRLGRGGMAVVYRVRVAGIGEPLALKQLTLSKDERRDQYTVSLFEREFYTLAQLSHPGIIRVYDYGVDPAGPYYTMDLLDGFDLHDRAPLPYPVACKHLLDVCSSLALLHSRRLVHRDVSPRNIRLTREGHAKLIDFGAMVPMGPSGRTVGTPAFAAPEVVHHAELDGRTDLFSIGATLYYALTGQPPFLAREFAQLPQAWRNEPTPPSKLVPGIPPALDHLVASLLRIDPAERPRSAFEVIQRLAAIAGIDHVEPAEASQGYLTTPVMVGRDAVLRSFRHRLEKSSRGDGGSGVLVHCAPGMGRTRLLEACTLEAKTLGITVLRASANDSSGEAFGCARKLCEQLLDRLPEEAMVAARDAGVAAVLFQRDIVSPSGELVETPPPSRVGLWAESTNQGRLSLQSALASWLLRVSRDNPLLVAVDDVKRVDEASCALLAALAHGAADRRLVVFVTADSSATPLSPTAFRVLTHRCAPLELEPLTLSETSALLTSVFGDVPNVSIVSEQLHRIAEGRPRQTMTLAQHLVDTHFGRYEAGRWTLPVSLNASDLPSSADAALASKFATLPRLARDLAQTQALSLRGAMSRADYAHLSRGVEGRLLNDAIETLTAERVLVSDGAGNNYSFAQAGFVPLLGRDQDPSERRLRHRALAELAELHEAGPIQIAYHWFHGDCFPKALEQLMRLSVDGGGAWEFEFSGMAPTFVAELFSGVLNAAVSLGARRRELSHLRDLIVSTSVISDAKYYGEAASDLLAQLKQDSGLTAYAALDPAIDSSRRMKMAMEFAAEQYANTPERDRVYSVQEAVQRLARYVVETFNIVSKTFDTRLLGSLPELLEPFESTSPLLAAARQYAIAACEIVYQSRAQRARQRWMDLYTSLESIMAESPGMVTRLRLGCVVCLVETEAPLGLSSALRWCEILEQEPLRRVHAMYGRRLVAIQQGDIAGAERCLKAAEVLTAQVHAHQFMIPLRPEIVAGLLTRDLGVIRQAMDRLRKLVVEYPGWIPHLHRAEGYFHALRGDFTAALSAFARCLEVASPDRSDPPPLLDVWIFAVHGTIWCLTELGQAEEAVALGRKALERCRELQVDSWSDYIVRELALAESAVGSHIVALERLDDLIRGQKALGVTGLRLGSSYEARAIVAIRCRDPLAAAEYAELAAREYGDVRKPALGVEVERLREEARVTGAPNVFEAAPPSSKGITAAPGTSDVALAGVVASMKDLKTASQRAVRALSLLCEAAHSSGGYLLLARGSRLVLSAVQNAPGAPVPLTAFVEGYWEQLLDDADMTTALTSMTHVSNAPVPVWTDPNGREHLLLSLVSRGTVRDEHVGLVVLISGSEHRTRRLPEAARDLASAVARHLVTVGDVAVRAAATG